MNPLDAADIDLICNLALAICLIYFILVNVEYDRILIANMADTARPQTPSRKLFKPSSKTRTPPVRKQPALASTPRSAQSTGKSDSPSPSLFRRSSGTTPKLVRKASSHVSTTPSKPAFEDITTSTPLAPLTSKLDVSEGSIPEYAASDTTGDTPIGLIDNDVLTPTDTFSRSTDAPKALSREVSEPPAGAANGSPKPDSTLTGSLNEDSETVTAASNEVPKQAPEPEAGPQQASEQSDSLTDVAPALPSALNDTTKEESPSASSPVDKLSNPTDLANYFLDHGNSEMSEFVKALLSPQEDSASTAVNALNSATSKGKDVSDKVIDLATGQSSTPQLQQQQQQQADISSPSDESTPEPADAAQGVAQALQNVANQVSDSIRRVPEVSHNPEEELPTGSRSTSKTPDATQGAQESPREVAEALQKLANHVSHSVSGFPEVSRKPTEELPTSDDLVSSPTSKPQGATESLQDATDGIHDSTVSGFPDVSRNPTTELPNNDELVATPTSKPQDVSQVADQTTNKSSEAISGFPDLSRDPVKELPTDDGLIMDPINKVRDATGSVPPSVSETQEEAQATASGIQKNETNGPKDVPPGDTVSHKIGVPDTEGISQGKDVTGDGSGKPLDIQDSIPSSAGDTGNEVGNLPTGASNGDVVSEATQNPSALKESAQSTPRGPEGSVRSTMAGAEPDVAAKSPQNPAGSSAANQAPSTPGGIQARANNMGKPAQVNRRVEIPLPRPEKASRPKSNMNMPEVDGLRSTDNLPNVNEIDDPPEEFLDPSVHSPQQPSANISPVPKISGITPITSQPPPELARLANGLGGHSIDDVGNIVDDSGKVLGHATGDLPSMIGKKVANNGEVYGDNGELIGFVTENFTGHPPPEAPKGNASKETALPGGLKVDMDGNILDSSGNIIGKLNSKPGESSKALAPYNGDSQDGPKTGTQKEEEKPEGEKPRARFEEGGIPADIFLDVKSTPDGIQLTIRIPTIFKQETRQTAS
ncbi:hypothetical protein SCUP515_01546 [Seiridium cupressi]